MQTVLGLFPEETLTSIENIRLEYLAFAAGKGGVVLRPAWVMDVYSENEGPQVRSLCFSAQTGQKLEVKDGLYR